MHFVLPVISPRMNLIDSIDINPFESVGLACHTQNFPFGRTHEILPHRTAIDISIELTRFLHPRWNCVHHFSFFSLPLPHPSRASGDVFAKSRSINLYSFKYSWIASFSIELFCFIYIEHHVQYSLDFPVQKN